ncbi:hypothetical protein GLOIN_2v1839140 [Rhizophagus clarus]|uniref:Uncharacterized protein n=1 Tax=Rhizophagus clarus TaxID=94130 RepID=A0A8H3MKB8_9GLOM|nr:hypothetical protein GLOIN_2v1839140 [Rhizophagus clarus]
MSNSRSVISHPLPKAELRRLSTGLYLFRLVGCDNYIEFIIPIPKDILKSCKKDSKKPPTVFLIFRNPVQQSLINLHFRFERNEVSKISAALWKWVKSNDPVLSNIFIELYKETCKEWRRGRLIIEFFTPLISDSCNDTVNTVNNGNDNNEKKIGSSVVHESKDKNEVTMTPNPDKMLICPNYMMIITMYDCTL